MKKIIVLLFAIITCLFAMTLTVSADEWVKTDKGYKYQYDDGTYAKSGWLNIDGKKYYIKSNGTRAKGWLTTKNGTKYYFGKNGAALKGWYKIGENKYYFDKNCKMATGEIIVDGTLHEFLPNGSHIWSTKLTGARKYLRIYDYGVYDVDSVGGVDPTIAWVNTSDKKIKYIYFTVTPRNAVDDTVKCWITGDSKKILSLTGPFAQLEGGYYYDYYQYKLFGTIWSNVWYNSNVKNFTISKVEIEYMDGSNVSITGDDLKEVFF